MSLRFTCCLMGLFLAAPLMAQEQAAASAPAAADPWSGKATLGYLATSGNTDNSSLNTAFEVGYATGKWSHLLKTLAIKSTESNATTAEAYEIGWKSEYSFSETNFMFGRLDWRKDRFSGYDTQFSQTVGYGRRILHNGAHTLNGEIGAGSRQSELRDGTTENDMILRGGLYYRWAFSETAEFTQDLTVESGKENTYLESVSKLKARLIGNLALVASYTIKNNSDVLPTIEKTDTFTALSLEYAF